MNRLVDLKRSRQHYSDQLLIARLQEENWRLREALVEAADTIEEMVPYISTYFVQKWGFDKDAAKVRAAAEPASSEGRDRQVMGAGSVSHGQSGDLNIAPGRAAAATQPASPHPSTREAGRAA